MRDPGSRSPTDIDRHVGAKVRELRVDAGMTLHEMSADLGISHQQLHKYETGTNRLSAGMIAEVARVLRVPIQALFDGADGRPAMAPSIPPAVLRSMATARDALNAVLQRAV